MIIFWTLIPRKAATTSRTRGRGGRGGRGEIFRIRKGTGLQTQPRVSPNLTMLFSCKYANRGGGGRSCEKWALSRLVMEEKEKGRITSRLGETKEFLLVRYSCSKNGNYWYGQCIWKLFYSAHRERARYKLLIAINYFRGERIDHRSKITPSPVKNRDQETVLLWEHSRREKLRYYKEAKNIGITIPRVLSFLSELTSFQSTLKLWSQLWWRVDHPESKFLALFLYLKFTISACSKGSMYV